MNIFSKFFIFALLATFSLTSYAGPGDTLVVQTYTFDAQNNPDQDYDNPGKRWFTMPEDDGTTYQKILMKYTLKCFEDGTAGGLGYACGEWDYTSHTFLYDHTGVIDSNLVNHPLYLANNQEFESIDLYTGEYSNYLSENLYSVDVTETISDSVFVSNLGNTELQEPFGNAMNYTRAQYLWTADELNAMGLSAGEIHALEFDFLSAESMQEVVKVQFMNSSLSELDEFDDGDFEDVYYWNLNIDNPGTNRMSFANPFVWDGTSSILVQIITEPNLGLNGVTVNGGESGFNSSVISSGTDGYLEVGEFDEVKVPIETFDSVEEEITIAFWAYGNEDALPASTYIFEGVNAIDERVLNSHLPWDNSRVYWDAGWDEGFDRIEKLATPSQFEGQWLHWAFVKNTITEEMKIYLNGSLWHSGTNKSKTMVDMVRFSIAHGVNSTGHYDGKIDEFQIWNTELSAADIQGWMNKDIDNTHPMYANLLAYYQFNGNNTDPIIDSSPNGFDSQAHGSPNRVKYRGHELFRNFNVTTERPNVNFVKGEYITTEISDTYSVVLPIAPIVVSEWATVDNAAVVTNLEHYWPVGNSITYDEDGNVIDTIEYESDITIVNSEFDYYQPPYEVINKWEVGRFITPYGIQLDLEEGWTWTYDVSDFVSLLQGEVELEAGNWQELLDLKFLFIEGTPPRDVMRIEQPWHGNWQLSTWQDQVLPQTYALGAGEEMAKLNVTTSGHWFGQGNNCAEFCNNIHNVTVNGDMAYSWEIMQECADNPLYPQGGTWIYDRAGWCPGAPVTKREFDITSYINNNELEVDYNITYDPYGNYWLTGHLVTYGNPNHANDVEINDILSPSMDRIKSRDNPVCNQPVIQIRNNGSVPLTSCVITYGVGTQTQEYNWTGNLGFLETENVSLTFDNNIMWEGLEDQVLTFNASVSLPNGVQDENVFNNESASQFLQPTIHSYSGLDDNRVIIRLKTNNSYWESSYTLYDINENVIFEKDDFSEGLTTYNDTLELSQGCYFFHVEDSDDDGLSFFANNDGTGFVRLKRVNSSNFITFNPNFGKEIKHAFYFQTDVVSVDEQKIENFNFSLFPNPAMDQVNIQFDGFDTDLTIDITNLDGELVYSSSFKNSNNLIMKPVDISKFASGMYYVLVTDKDKRLTKKLVVEK